jgi:hypothetical protein
MANFSLSPSVEIKESEVNGIVQSVATSIGGYAGKFTWGPAFKRVDIDTEQTLLKIFSKPVSYNADDWYAASNYLAYSNFLKTVRVVNRTAAKNAVTASTGVLIANEDESIALIPTLGANKIVARYAGALGNNLEVSIADNASFSTWKYRQLFALSGATFSTTLTTDVTFTGDITSASDIIANVAVALGSLKVGQVLINSNLSVGASIAEIVNQTTIRISTPAIGTAVTSAITGTITETRTVIPGQPGTSEYVELKGGSNDELHVVVVDRTGLITGTAGSVLEQYSKLSKAVDARSSTGAANYYKDVINQGSTWIYITAVETVTGGSAIGSASTSAFGNITSAPVYTMTLGVDGESSITTADIIAGYALFADAAQCDLSYLITGSAGDGANDAEVARYCIEQIAEVRKDTIVFHSPPLAAVLDNTGSEIADIVAYRNKFNNSTYAVMDTGWKYQYDRYNDTYVWVPLNADIAGLCARTDSTNDPWWSPGGYNRGYIKNVVRLAFNPTSKSTHRDVLYPEGINPVITEAGTGTILLGDKTMTKRPTLFGSIGPRRLFIIIEKAIANMAKYTLFEFNDSITRTRFYNTLVPYLRDIQGRRGCTDFKVISDETVNTPFVIENSQFVARILVRPNMSINYMTLNFVAVGATVSFDEIG